MEIDPRYHRPAEVDLLIGEATKARETFGWQPRIAFDQLVKLMVDHDLELAKQEATASESKRSKTSNPTGWGTGPTT